MNLAFDKFNTRSLDKNFDLLKRGLLNVRPVQRLFKDASAGALTVFLPDGDNVADDYFVIKTDVSGNAVTLSAFGTQTINGSGTLALAAQYDKALLTYSSGVWYIVST